MSLSRPLSSSLSLSRWLCLSCPRLPGVRVLLLVGSFWRTRENIEHAVFFPSFFLCLVSLSVSLSATASDPQSQARAREDGRFFLFSLYLCHLVSSDPCIWRFRQTPLSSSVWSNKSSPNIQSYEDRHRYVDSARQLHRWIDRESSRDTQAGKAPDFRYVSPEDACAERSEKESLRSEGRPVRCPASPSSLAYVHAPARACFLMLLRFLFFFSSSLFFPTFFFQALLCLPPGVFDPPLYLLLAYSLLSLCRVRK